MIRRFVETSIFSRQLLALEKSGEVSDGDLTAMEQELLSYPQAGALVKDTGGMRKIRVAQRGVGRGKSGGARVYYFDLETRQVTYLIAIYTKRTREDLSPAERKILKGLAAVLKRETS